MAAAGGPESISDEVLHFKLVTLLKKVNLDVSHGRETCDSWHISPQLFESAAAVYEL